MANSKIGISQADLDKTWSRNEDDWVFEKYASSEEKKEYKSILNNKDKSIAVTSEDYKKKITLKYYDQAKKDYQTSTAQKAEEARKKAEEAKAKAKPKTDYEEWKAKQPKNNEKSWLSSVESFIKNNKDKIVGVAGLIATVGAAVAGVAALTPQLKSALSGLKDAIKNKKKPSEEEQKEIDKNPKSVSTKMYSFIRDSEDFTPYVQQQGYVLKLGFGYIVETTSPYYTAYPTREDNGIINEYLYHVQDDTIEEWLKGVKPALAPKDMIYTLFNRDIQNIESLINKEITDVVLEQHEFDALVSFLWSMRDEGKIYPEYTPERLIKEIHSLIYYDSTKKTVTSYMKDVDKELVQPASTWNRRQSEITLFLTGNYESLSIATTDKADYDEVFSDMKNQYLVDKTGNKNLNCYTTFIGNESVPEALEECSNKNIILPNTKKEQSPNEILNSDIVSKMIYPVLLKSGAIRKGYNNTGINNVDYICYGWFGSERGEGQGIHYGVDLVCEKNNPIVLPYSGTIDFIGMATESTTTLKRVVFRPDFNTDIVISLYYLVNLQVSNNTHYEAGKLVGYIGDCSELFETLRHNENVIPFDYLHIQANYDNEKGVPLNLTSAIINATNAEEPEEITYLKNNPLIHDSVAGEKTINIQHKGKYRIVLVGSGGAKISYNLEAIPSSELPDIVPRPYRYSLTGSNGAYVNVITSLENKQYEYRVGNTNNHTSFNHELIANQGKSADKVNDIQSRTGADYIIPENYTLFEASKGNTTSSVQNVGGYNPQTGECVSYVIKSSINAPYETYGKGGDVGLNGGTPSNETGGLVYIQYIDWN